MSAHLPPGPRLPSVLQTVGWQTRPLAYQERCRARYGKRYTTRLLGTPPFVMHADPGHIKEIFTAPPEVLHPGEGARILEPVVGSYSVILLDEKAHISQRKLMLPAFHGEKMQLLADLVAEVTEREVANWPTGSAVEFHTRLQGLTLEVILRAVFGLERGERLDALRTTMTEILTLSTQPLSLIPQLQRDIPGVRDWSAFEALRDEADRLIFELIDERRTAGEDDRNDVLAMLLAARHEDGTEMNRKELRDELMTMLVAGHETTASSLAFAFKLLARHPHVVEQLAEGDEDYLAATIHEVLRARPVLPNSAPRLVKQPVEIGGWHYEPGVCLVPNAYLVHHDPEIYPDPYTFRPERFLDEAPGTYTWIPFGGGRRRCLGASFAILEMKTVLREVAGRYELQPAGEALELTRRRAITISPQHGARMVLTERAHADEPARELVAS
jgi:cytochrome P450